MNNNEKILTTSHSINLVTEDFGEDFLKNKIVFDFYINQKFIFNNYFYYFEFVHKNFLNLILLFFRN